MEINRVNLLALIQSGIKRDRLSVTGLERQAGVPKDTIRDFLRGKTQVLRADKLQKILAILEPKHVLRITGYTDSQGAVVFMPEVEEVACPPGHDPLDVIAIRVKGDALMPLFHDGWVVYYTRKPGADIPAISGGWQVPYGKGGKEDGGIGGIVGKPCVVGLKDGRVLIGTLKQPAKRQAYDLMRYDAGLLKNIEPEWLAKIIFIKTD